jgi:hypothetical protein
MGAVANGKHMNTYMPKKWVGILPNRGNILSRVRSHALQSKPLRLFRAIPASLFPRQVLCFEDLRAEIGIQFHYEKAPLK